MKSKIEKVYVVIVILIIVTSIIISKPLEDLDEIWNYNTARAIATGLIPYKDVSMITTPLLPILTAILLKITINELIISRILTAIIWTGILFVVYKIFKILLKEENISLIITALIGILCREIYCIDYNIATLFITLIILYKELKSIQDTSINCNKNNLLIRHISGTCYMYETKYRNNISWSYNNI